MKFCFEFKGKKICIYIPILVWPWIPPWIRKGPQPDPWKWLDGPGLSEKLQQEILTVGLINELAKSLSPDKAKRVQAVTRELIGQKDLPEGSSISF